MTPLQNLYYAIGEMAYAVASADGEVQKEERQRFSSIVSAELRCDHFGFSISDIVFQIMDKEKQSTENAYNWAMKQIRMNSHYLSPEIKKDFIRVMEKIAKAYPPVTLEERDLIEKFKKDIEPLTGDPVYYNSI